MKEQEDNNNQERGSTLVKGFLFSYSYALGCNVVFPYPYGQLIFIARIMMQGRSTKKKKDYDVGCTRKTPNFLF